MCGLLFSYSLPSKVHRVDFETALSLQRHRGPDHSRIETDEAGQLFLGHNRLSIIDLSPAGTQPFHTACGRYTLLFNGEIYNYKNLRAELNYGGEKFSTNSDTEVLLLGIKRNGPSFVDKLEGMFAFVFVDNIARTVMFGRDEGGEKPLFYSAEKNSIIISSELSSLNALIHSAPKLCDLSITEYLVHGYPLGERTLLSGVRSCEPGVIKFATLSDVHVTNLHTQSVSDVSSSDLVGSIKQAVTSTLVADVPVCVSLSGGLDSSLIVALASRMEVNVNTFSVIFEKDKNFDESKLSRSIAKHFGTTHTEIPVGDISDELILEAFDCIDTPIIDSSIIPTFCLYREISKHFKVVLGGDGADEIFGGYKHLKRYHLADRFNMNFAFKALNTLQLPDRHKTKILNWHSLLNDSTQNIRKFIGTSDELPEGYRELFAEVTDTWFDSDLTSQTFLDIVDADYENYLKRSILVKSDRCSMAHSIEARSPFLNQQLRRYRKKLRYGRDFDYRYGKKELINIARQLFPEDYPFGYKRGFNFALADYLQKKRINVFWDLVFENYVGFEQQFLERIRNSTLKYSGGGQENLVFGLALLNFWAKKIGVQR